MSESKKDAYKKQSRRTREGQQKGKDITHDYTTYASNMAESSWGLAPSRGDS